MVVILILWHIKQGQEQAFIKAWKEDLFVNNREKLVGEFLSKTVDEVEDIFKSWKIATVCSPVEPVTPYVNVGIWESLAAFLSEIKQYIQNPGASSQPWFVAKYRVVLEPVAWRIGGMGLPNRDSGRTF